jgi:hypothetical protein
MSVDFGKLLSHPDKDEIISKLVTGIQVSEVSDWLKLKYSDEDQKHLRLSQKMLKTFLDNNLDLYQTLQDDIQIINSGQDIEISESLKNNKTYKQRLTELAEEELDVKKIMVETVFLIRQRVEQVFDKAQESPESLKPDPTLIKWLELLMNSTDKYNKIVNQAPDSIVQHNVSIQVIEQHTALLQDAIRETMAEIDPQMAFLFLDKLNEKMAKIQEPQQVSNIPLEKRLSESQILEAKIQKIEGSQ